MNDLKLSVVIPAYNEEKNLPEVLTALQAELRTEGIPYELVVVNDGSRDSTAGIVEAFIENDARIRLINRTFPNGFGRAIRAGLDHITGDVAVVYMADSSDHPVDVVRYYRKIEEGYDCVFGSRFVNGSHVVEYPRVKLIVNRIVNKSLQWFFFCPFNDLTNAFKAYRTAVIRDCGPYRASHFNITIEMSLSALIRGYNVAQIPISWTGRTWGSSHLRLKEMGRRYLATLLKVIAERLLIADDLLAERLAGNAKRESQWLRQERQLTSLARRLDEVERRIETGNDSGMKMTRDAA